MTQAYDIAAYVWPAYHDEPRWRAFMPEGIGEWQTIKQAQPRFDGHDQPRVPMWGYESDSDPQVMAKKIAAAADHGVNVFAYDWYWYDDQPFLEDSLASGFLQARNRDRMRFYLMWANHDAKTLWDLRRSHEKVVVWPGAVDLAAFEHATERIIERFMSRDNYYRIDGCPLFCIYDLTNLVEGLGGPAAAREALDDFRRRVREAGHPDLHLQAILWRRLPPGMSLVPGDANETRTSTVEALGLDSLTSYQWCHTVQARGDYEPWARQAQAEWEQAADEFPVPCFPHVSVGWDTNPRFHAYRKNTITGETPERFAAALRRAMDFVDRRGLCPPLITVNSWNEWSEGSYLEPDERFGMGYLEAVRAALDSRAK